MNILGKALKNRFKPPGYIVPFLRRLDISKREISKRKAVISL